MMELLPISIGLGLLVSLLLAETLGIAAAGMVVPGYVALLLGRPTSLVLMLLASVITYGVVRSAGAWVVIYGRRRTALSILIGYLVGAALASLVPSLGGATERTFGYIIPGLIAIWMDRQGLFVTIISLTICSVLVRLLLLLFFVDQLGGLLS